MTTSTLRPKDEFGGRNKHNHTMPSLLSKEEQEACSSNNNKAAATSTSACSPAPSSFARTSSSTSSSSQQGTSTTKVETKPVEATTGATTKSSTTATAVAATSTAATATTKAATTTATTPFQLSQRPRQITPPGVTIDSSFSISPSNNGDYALVSHSFGGTVTSSSPLTSSVRSETNGAAGKNSHTANDSNSSTAEVSPSLRGGSSTTRDPEGRQEGDHHDDRRGSSPLGGEKSPMKSAVGGSGNSGSSSSAGLPSLSLEGGQQRDPTVDVTSSWDDFAVLSFMSSPILKKKDPSNKSSSNDKDSPSTATSSAVVPVYHHHLPDRQRSYFHHQLDHHQAHYHGFSPSPPPSKGSARSSSSRHYDVWERMNPTMGNVGFGSRGGGPKAGGAGNNPVLPFVASHERPANMQRQHLLRLPPLTSSPSRGPKLSSSSSTMDQPPTSVLTSPHMLYGWLRTRFAAGLVRSSFNILHDMLTRDYQQAKTLLGKIHQDQPRSEVYISELLTLRDHLAGLWCVYAHFALDVGRLTRTIQDDEPFPAPSAATATKGAAPKGKKNVGPSLSSDGLLKGPASDENDFAAFVKRNSSTYGGALRLQMINSPVRPTKRKRKKTTKAVESEENEAQLDEVETPIEQKMSNKASAASGATAATTKSKKDDDEYIPKKLTSNNPRRKKKRLKTDHGSTSAKKKRPASKQSKTSDFQEAAKKKTGHWTKAEHERFLEGIATYGRGKWKAIADVVKTRTTVQVKTHGQSYFRDDGTHHIQTIDSTPEQKVVSRKMRTKENNTKKPPEAIGEENRTPVQDDANDAVPRKTLRPDRRTVLSYEDDREEDFDDDGSDIDINDTAASTLATPVPKSRIAPPPLTPIVPTPQHHPPSLMTSPYMGTTSISNLEDLVLGGGLFSPSEFSQVDRLQNVESGAQNIDHLATPRTFGRSLDAALSLSEGPKDTPLTERKSTPRQTAISGLTPPRPVLWDRFLDDMPPYMRGFFTSVGILSTDQLVKTPTKNLSEIYMSYQRDQTNAVVSSIAPSEVPSAKVGDKAPSKKATNKKTSEDGTYQDVAGFALSVLLAARKCPLVGNHHFIVLAMGRMIVSTAPMEKTPNGASHVDVPTAIITSRINSAITASWDGVRSCHGCAVDENKIFFQDPNSAKKAISLLASLDFDGKKKISEDKIRNSVLREEMNSIFSFPSILRKDAGRPEGFVFNDRHAVLALFWELNRWSRLEEKLRTNKSGKSVRIGESPWCQPTYQIEDLPMLATVDAITDSWNNCAFAKGDKDSSTVVWEW